MNDASLSVSLVVYKTPLAELDALLQLITESGEIAAWVVVDNAATEESEAAAELRREVERRGGMYIASLRNVGFGAGHNLALRALGEHPSEFHLMLNPDILFAPSVLAALTSVMREHPRTALLMPRIVYPDGSPQPLCKLLPTPLDFALRRFAPSWLQRMFAERLRRYELTGIENTPCNKVPFLSGCFMFTRRDALELVGGFDERYFLYLEDVDLCRRLAQQGELLYWPEVAVTHGCVRGAYRSTRLMAVFLRSAILYFNKWGWFFDATRRKANREALECLPDARAKRN